MANGRVEIHDPLSNNNLTSSKLTDPEATSDRDGMEDTVEFKLLMAYAKRRRPKKDAESPAQDSPMVAQNGDAHVKGQTSPQTPAKTGEEVKKKKKKRISFKPLSKFFSCVKPQIEDEEQPRIVSNEPDDLNGYCQFRIGTFSSDGEPGDALEEVASRLTEIADDIPFTPPEIEADAQEDDVEKVIALLLREAGDRLNEQELKNAAIATELFWNYSFFTNIITRLLERMGLMPSEPNALGPRASPKTQIAVTCEVASRLSAVNTLPMSRMLDHGARYLQDHYSSWVQQQGGYEEAFHSDEEEEDED